MQKKLFIPGPTEVKNNVLKKMSTPLIEHRGKEASDLQRSISQKLQKMMFTDNEILLSTSSGSGLMEGAIRSCTRNKAAVFSCGSFGERWYEMALANQVKADCFKVEYGCPIRGDMVDREIKSGEYDLVTITHNETSTGVMNPINEIAEVMRKYPEIVFCVDTVSSLGGVSFPVDELGVDICISSSQKCLGLPPGLSLCSISEKAIELARKVKYRGMYFDLLKLYEYLKKKNYQYPSTPSLSHMFALDYQLDLIFQEGLENRFQRHLDMANIVREWANNNFALFPEEAYASNTVTCIKNTKGVNVQHLNQMLGLKGYTISNGYGKLKEKTFRIAHMGDINTKEVKELLAVIDEILKQEG